MKKSSGKGYWEKQVDKFCDIFGFKVNHCVMMQAGCRPAKDIYTLKKECAHYTFYYEILLCILRITKFDS